LAIYEVENAIWKQNCLLKKLENGQVYLEYLYGLIDSGVIDIVDPSEDLIQESYLLAKRNGIAIYDSIFVCLAIKLGLSLKTLDKRQADVFEKIRKKSQQV
jgi:predicted nucleic acid-binding protein